MKMLFYFLFPYFILSVVCHPELVSGSVKFWFSPSFPRRGKVEFLSERSELRNSDEGFTRKGLSSKTSVDPSPCRSNKIVKTPAFLSRRERKITFSLILKCAICYSVILNLFQDLLNFGFLRPSPIGEGCFFL